MKIVVGLGNPGRVYARNRHNIGFMCLNNFARKQGIQLDKKQGKARTGAGEVGGERVILARPQTFMNLSGQAVKRLVDKSDIDPAELIIIHDDLDLPLGRIRVRCGGGSGGHNGVHSVIASLGSRDFIRLRVGIGRPAVDTPDRTDEDVISYVLGDFSTEERKTLNQVIPRVSETIFCLLTEGIPQAMNKYNRDLC